VDEADFLPKDGVSGLARDYGMREYRKHAFAKTEVLA
jgi:hypothetical protein